MFEAMSGMKTGEKAVGHYRGGDFHNFYNQQNSLFKWLIGQRNLSKAFFIIYQK